MALSGFTPAYYLSATAGPAQSVLALPGAGTVVVINNFGDSAVALLLQVGATPPSPAVSSNNGIVLKPSDPPLVLVIGPSDHVAVVALGNSAQLNLTVGA